jgi:hypothetical protein
MLAAWLAGTGFLAKQARDPSFVVLYPKRRRTKGSFSQAGLGRMAWT